MLNGGVIFFILSGACCYCEPLVRRRARGDKGGVQAHVNFSCGYRSLGRPDPIGSYKGRGGVQVGKESL